MTGPFLHGADVVTRFEQMRRKAVPQRVRTNTLGDPDRTRRLCHGLLHR